MVHLTKMLFLAALLACASANADNWQIEGASRVVAISDIHGAYDAMVETLQRSDVIDDELSWTGENTHLVIVGDILDRGPRSRDAMDLLMRLEGEAASAGGAVHVLIGNHESMNLIGDMRYVSKSEYAAFAADETQEERQKWFEAYAGRHGADPSSDDARAKFDRQFPAGFFALRRAFRPDGVYGRWLLEKPVIAVINGTAFVHGGLSPLVAELGLDGVNRGLKNELLEYVSAQQALIDAGVLLPTDSYYDIDGLLANFMPALDESATVLDAVATVQRLGQSDLFDPDGPLWYRGSVSCGGLIEEPRLDAALQAIGAVRVVVGHTPTLNRRILQRFDGRVIEIDTGMLNAYYKGRGNALVLEGDAISVVTQSGEGSTAPLSHPRYVGARPSMLSPDDLQQMLENGEIVSQQQDAADRTVVEVSDGRFTVSAIFKKRGARGFYPDVAAYRLDRMLELDMVPVSVMRVVNGVDGSLQFLPARFSDEAKRSASGRGAGASCAIPDQWAAMYVFDVLIYNEGRSQQRMLYDPTDWGLILIEHDRAFSGQKGRPRHLAGVSLALSAGWQEALSELTDERLEERFSDVLDKRRLKGLRLRRDELLAGFAGAR